MLRQIELEIANGKIAPQACRDTDITAQTYYRWRKELGGLKLDQAKRLKELERENAKLKRLVAELSLEKQILKYLAEEAPSGAGARWNMRAERPVESRSGLLASSFYRWCWGDYHKSFNPNCAWRELVAVDVITPAVGEGSPVAAAYTTGFGVLKFV